jgi:hypothetical protein
MINVVDVVVSPSQSHRIPSQVGVLLMRLSMFVCLLMFVCDIQGRKRVRKVLFFCLVSDTTRDDEIL